MLYFYRIDSKSYGSDITSEGTDTPQRRQSATHPTGANPLINYPCSISTVRTKLSCSISTVRTKLSCSISTVRTK